MMARIDKLRGISEFSAAVHADKRSVVALEAGIELCVIRFGISGTIDVLECQIDFLREFCCD